MTDYPADVTARGGRQGSREHRDDGATYAFLLKGHEDIRQDERVMQLFSLINNLLANDPVTSKSHLSLGMYFFLFFSFLFFFFFFFFFFLFWHH